MQTINCKWLSIRSTIVNNNLTYTPYNSTKNDDRFCKSINKYVSDSNICILFNGCHYDVALYSNNFCSLIYSYFFKRNY